MRIAQGVFVVHDKGHAVLFLKVGELLHHVAHDDDDVVDAGRVQLLDLALDEHFALAGKQPLRRVVAKGNEPR